MPMIDGNVGVEYLTVDFPWSQYPGHFLVREGWREEGRKQGGGPHTAMQHSGSCMGVAAQT